MSNVPLIHSNNEDYLILHGTLKINEATTFGTSWKSWSQASLKLLLPLYFPSEYYTFCLICSCMFMEAFKLVKSSKRVCHLIIIIIMAHSRCYRGHEFWLSMQFSIQRFSRWNLHWKRKQYSSWTRHRYFIRSV